MSLRHGMLPGTPGDGAHAVAGPNDPTPEMRTPPPDRPRTAPLSGFVDRGQGPDRGRTGGVVRSSWPFFPDNPPVRPLSAHRVRPFFPDTPPCPTPVRTLSGRTTSGQTPVRALSGTPVRLYLQLHAPLCSSFRLLNCPTTISILPAGQRGHLARPPVQAGCPDRCPSPGGG